MERFEIIEKVAGQGGYGTVDKAKDSELERLVAIKSLDPIFREVTPKDIDRFKREAKTLAALVHPYIPAIYDVDFDPDNNSFKIIYEWIEGKTLSRYLMENGVIGVDKIVDVFEKICSALDLAHSKGIIHRDIKPSNLIIAQSDNSCYVVDFGISLNKEDVQRLTEKSGGIGTAGYMSPEQENNEELSPASDVYSLGIVLYELMAGSSPNLADFKKLSDIDESIPPAIDKLIQDCLREVTDRVQSANEFLTKLKKSVAPKYDLGMSFAEGSLYDIISTLRVMNPDEYKHLPRGQKILTFSRLNSLVKQDESRMKNPIASFINSLLTLTPELSIKEFTSLMKHAIRYGFEEQYGPRYFGNIDIREKLIEMAILLPTDKHLILADEFITYYDTIDLSTKERWHAFHVKDIFHNLLANDNGGNAIADNLGEKYEESLLVCY